MNIYIILFKCYWILAWWRPYNVETCSYINSLNAELNPICHLLALLGAHHILHVSRIRVKEYHSFSNDAVFIVSFTQSRKHTTGCCVILKLLKNDRTLPVHDNQTRIYVLLVVETALSTACNSTSPSLSTAFSRLINVEVLLRCPTVLCTETLCTPVNSSLFIVYFF